MDHGKLSPGSANHSTQEVHNMWTIVVTFVALSAQSYSDFYVFTTPRFAAAQNCINYVQQHQIQLAMKALDDSSDVGAVDRILCVQTDLLQQYLEGTTEGKKI